MDVLPPLETFARECLEPLVALVDPTRRLFWPHLVAAGLLAGLVWARRVRKSGRPLLAFLFPKDLWLHPSALLDYRFLFVRAFLGALLVVPVALSAQALSVPLSLALVRALGIGPLADASRATVLVCFSVAAFVTEDFFRWWAHWASHRFAPLWELHKVHHSAEVLTPFTLNRTHPLEGLLMQTASAVGLGLAAGVCAWLFHGRIAAWEILGVEGLAFVWTFAGSNLRHSHVWLSFGPVLEHVFLSPAQHQVHHSLDPKHHDRNLGEALAVWDWLFGTLYVTRARERLRFGLSADQQNHRATVRSMLLAPMLAAARALVRR
ncbi:MAG: sterol desaturase family protein [Myxococcota bacterium]